MMPRVADTGKNRRLWERQFEKVPLEHGWETVLNSECLFFNRARGLFLSVYVNDIKLAGKTENIGPTWTILMEDVDLGEPIANYRDMFESRISAGAKEKLPTKASGKPDAETISFCERVVLGKGAKVFIS